MNVNVREPWEMHDSICIDSTLYGSEASAGFYTTFVGFAETTEHLFFKRRSEGNVHRAYNNQQAEDRSDFVFQAFQVGLCFIAPPTPLDFNPLGVAPFDANELLPVFWAQDLPRHCSISLKIGQDTNLRLQAMMCSPGYGPHTGGVAYGVDDTNIGVNFPEMVSAASQGVPTPSSRYWIAGGSLDNPQPIGIPKGELIEMKLKLSEWARGMLLQAAGPGVYRIGGTGEAEATSFPTRYGIQASLWGYREVQQRGELRAT